MTRSMLDKTCVLFALVSTSLVGCASDSAAPTRDAAASPPDTMARLDTIPDSVQVADVALDMAADSPPDAGTDTTPATDMVVDAAPALDFGVATSSIQRIVNPQVPAADSTTLASDNAGFAFDAYRKLIGTDNNLVFSPASISIALAMTYAGAAGATASEMAKALHFTLPQERLHPAFNALDQALASRAEGRLGADGGPMRLRIVNSLWAEQTYIFKSDFLASLAANYGANVNLLDFISAPEPSRISINDWVAEQTEGKILDLLPSDSIDSSVRLVLTNAVYFNARWQTAFDPQETRDNGFTLLDGSQVTTKFMHADLANLRASQGTNFKAVSLPYLGGSLSMVVVVPEVGQFSQVESSLDATALAALVAGMTAKTVSVGLPRFRIETSTDLKELLEALGMTSAFSNNADFSGMDGTRNLSISAVIHKAFIDVGENGTEAAAATAVVMVDGGMRMVDLDVRASRPFLYFLRDEPTGAILFMGRVLDPSKN